MFRNRVYRHEYVCVTIYPWPGIRRKKPVGKAKRFKGKTQGILARDRTARTVLTLFEISHALFTRLHVRHLTHECSCPEIYQTSLSL